MGEFLFEPEAEHMASSFEYIQTLAVVPVDVFVEALVVRQLRPIAVVEPGLMNKPELGELGPWTEGRLGDRVEAVHDLVGDKPGHVALVWVPTAAVETELGGNPGGEDKVELETGDAGSV